MKVKKQKKLKHSPSTRICCNGGRPCLTVSQYQLVAPVMQDLRHLCSPNHPHHFSQEDPQRVIGKQCRPRSDAAKCGV